MTRKACGQPLMLWLMLVETKSLKSIFVHGTGLGQPKPLSLGLLRQRWLSPATLPDCCGAKVGSMPDMGCAHVLTGGLSAQHCHSTVSDASAPLPLAALCLVLGCMIFPDGWDAETIRDMCGEKTGKYSLGDCSVRWAYILAIIGILNALILSFLAFVLGNRQNDLLHEELKTESKGEHRATGGILGGNSLGGLAPPAAWQGSHGPNCHLQAKPGWAGWEAAAEPLPSPDSLTCLSLFPQILLALR